MSGMTVNGFPASSVDFRKTESGYLRFVEVRDTGKTKIWEVRHGDLLATIAWYPGWRQYVLRPEPGTIWNVGCLAVVEGFIGAQMRERARSKCNCQLNGLGMVAENSGNCPVHPLPGCPNPACGETWIEAFHGNHCDACGWKQ